MGLVQSVVRQAGWASGAAGLAGEGSWACAAVTQPTLAVNGDRIELNAARNEQNGGTGIRVFAGAFSGISRRR